MPGPEERNYFKLVVLSLADLAIEASKLNGRGQIAIKRGIQQINSLCIPVWRGRLKPGQEDQLLVLETELRSIDRYDLNELLSSWQDNLSLKQRKLVSSYWQAKPARRTKILASL